MYKLFLDDERFPTNIEWYVICRTYDQAVNTIKENGFPIHIQFDHDLWVDESGSIWKSGYDFAKYIVELDIETTCIPENFTFDVHSMNPVGNKNIRDYLNWYFDFKKKLFWF